MFFLPITIFAQINIKNHSSIKPDTNLLFVGINNKIETTGIVIDTTSIDIETNLRLTSSNGKVSNQKWQKNIFWVSVHGQKTDTLRLYINNILTFTKIFDVRYIGNPIAKLGNITDTTVTVKEIISNPDITVRIPNCYYNHKMIVTSFDLFMVKSGDTIDLYQKHKLIDTYYDIDPENGETKKRFAIVFKKNTDKSTYGNKLTKKQQKRVKKLNTNDKLIIERIKVTCPNCVTRLLNPIILTIKKE